MCWYAVEMALKARICETLPDDPEALADSYLERVRL